MRTYIILVLNLLMLSQAKSQIDFKPNLETMKDTVVGKHLFQIDNDLIPGTVLLRFPSNYKHSEFGYSDQEGGKKYTKFVIDGIEFRKYTDSIFVVDVMPEFPGGKENLIKFIQENLEYPKSAIKDKVEGMVIISFVVTETGKVNYSTLIKSVRDDLDKEAKRIIKKMPKWKPGEKNGNPIPVAFNLPIVFKL